MSTDLPLPNTATLYFIARDDAARFFYKKEADARALARIEADENPGETVHVYEVRLIHRIKVTEAPTIPKED